MPQKKKILLSSANPDRNFLALVNEEMNKINKALMEIPQKVQIASKANTTFRELVDTFLKTDEGRAIELLHFCGHSSKYGIHLQDDNRAGDYTSVNSFINLLNQPNQLKIVFLNSCSSQYIGNTLVDQGVVEVVIETTHAIYDRDAVIFAEYFYRSLVVGKSLRASFQLAKEVLLKESKQQRGTARGPGFEHIKTFPWRIYPDTEDPAHTVNSWRLFEPLSKELEDPGRKKLLCVFPDSVDNQNYFAAVKNTIASNDFLPENTQKIYVESFLRLKEETNTKDLIKKFDCLLFFLSKNFNIFWNGSTGATEDANKVYFENAIQQQKVGLLFCDGDIENSKKNFQEITTPIIEMPPSYIGLLLTLQSIQRNYHLSKENALAKCKDRLKELLASKDVVAKKVVSEALTTGFKDFNFEEQRTLFEKDHTIDAFSTFNLLLIEGTKYCAHEVLVKRIFDFAQPPIIQEESKVYPITISNYFESEDTIEANDIWATIADYVLEDKKAYRELSRKEKALAFKHKIATSLLQIMQTQNLIIILDEIETSTTIITAINTFWKELEQASEQSNIKTTNKKLLLFALNKGLSDTCNFQGIPLHSSPLYAALPMKPIGKVGDKIFSKWYNNAFLMKILQHDKRYAKIKEKQADILKEPYVAQVLSKICTEMDCKEIFEDVLKIEARR